MKLVVFDDLPEGGAKRVVFEQVKGLSQYAQVDYVTNRVKSVFRFEEYATSIHRFDMSLNRHFGLFRPFQELSFVTKVVPAYRRIVSLILELNPDVVLVHPSMISQAPLILSMIKKPTIYYAEEWPRVVYEPNFHPLPLGFHGQYERIRRQIIRYVDKKSVAAAKTVITTSTYLQTMLSTLYDRNIHLIPPGVDLNTFIPETRLNTKKSYFLFLGERELINGYPLLSSALDAGEKILFVTFKGQGFRYSDAELANLYQGAIATLCLAKNEPFGLTAIESMACGTPVIAVNSGGYLDTVRSNKNGLLINYDESELYTAMRRLKKDSFLRSRMGKQARADVLLSFNWNAHIKKLMNVIEDMI